MPVSISGTNGVTFPDNSLQAAAASPFGLKNRLINADMRIDQRNAGAAVTANNAFPVDRFTISNGTDGSFSAQQSTSIVPNGFTHSLGITITAADTSLGATQALTCVQRIEGYNIADLSWGTANAQTVTLSFWVRSSLTGTFGGSLRNSSANRSYPFIYTISAANTWELKTITITGDTSGTWLTDSGVGIILALALGSGVDRSGTAGAWNSNNNASATGATSVVGTNGATWYVTGVQLEIGSTATPFERRMYGQELALCQRYFTSFVGAVAFSQYGIAEAVGTTKIRWPMQCPVVMRSSPTLTVNGSGLVWALDRIGTSLSSISLDYATTQIQSISATTANGITVGQAGSVNAGNFTNTSINFSSEL